MRDSKYHTNIGGASIILLIAVFAMTVFAVLSIRASYNELKMAEKNRDSVEAYYEADAAAEEINAVLCRTWQAMEKEDRQEAAAVLADAGSLKEEAVFRAEGDILDYFVKVDYNRTIQVTICFSAEEYRIAGWRLVTEEYGSYDGEENEIWDGVISK